MLKMIMCLDSNHGFAKDNKIPWNIPNEIQHFLKLTKNKTIVMGSKTFFSIGKTLKNRKNIILTKNKKLIIHNAICVNNYKKIIKLSQNKDVYVIGGAKVFDLFLKHADEIIISRLHQSYNCDHIYNPDLYGYKLTKTIKHKEFNIEYYKSNRQKLMLGEPIVAKILSNQIDEFNKIILAGIEPKIVIIYVGNSIASEKFINNKIKYAKQLGVEIDVRKYNELIDEDLLINDIHNLNINKSVHGIMVQLPLPINMDKERILNSINPNKDIDCLSFSNFSQIQFSNNNLIPCTPKAILEIFKFYKISLKGKNVTVLGRSKIVGLPISWLLLNNNATVTICHSYSKNTKRHLKNADIIISAVGKPNFIKATDIKNNAIIIDVSTNYINNKIIGDVYYQKVIDKVKYITPVPKGVGPVTVAMLFQNLLYLLNKQINKK